MCVPVRLPTENIYLKLCVNLLLRSDVSATFSDGGDNEPHNPALDDTVILSRYLKFQYFASFS